jgi:acyl carrier protein
MNETLTKLQSIFRDLFDEDDLVITNETSANDIDDWDSITHIQLLVLIEKEFGVKFSSAEIHNFKTVGDIVKCIENKQK